MAAAETGKKAEAVGAETGATRRSSSGAVAATRVSSVAPHLVVGNQATQHAIQAKRRMPGVSDRSEVQADRAADAAVAARHNPDGGRAPLAGSPEPGVVDAGFTGGLGAGQPLDETTRARFEAHFGRDLSTVRIHTDGGARERAEAIQARAFTVDHHIAFAQDQYAPATDPGRWLLAHELTHVLQQAGRSSASPLIQRVPNPVPTSSPATADLSPANRLRQAAEQVETVALPRFQAAVDDVSEPRIQEAGLLVLALWQNVETASRDARPQVSTATGPPPLPDDLQLVYDRVRRAVLTGISSQKYRGRWVLGREETPRYAGDVSQYIIDQSGEVGWTARDTVSLVDLLGRDNLSVTEQWTVVGLLRQHMNPWDFAYMLAVVDGRGLMARFDRLGPAPKAAYIQLLDTQGQLRLQNLAQPFGGLGALTLLPAERKVRLLQPLSPREIAEMLYGDADLWSTLLLPYNRAALEGVGENSWLLLGTELIVDPERLIARYRGLFVGATLARREEQRRGTRPYLWAQPEEAAVVGNTVRYGVAWPNTAYDYVDLQWWIENDPRTVRERGIPARVTGPRGRLRWVGESQNATVETRADEPGNHAIHCRLTHPDGQTEVLTYTQTVMTLEQKTDIEARRDFDLNRTPNDLLAQLRQERDRLGTASPTRRAELDRRIRAIEDRLQEANVEARRYLGHQAHLTAVRAVYVSAEERPMSVPLSIYVDTDPGYFDAPDYHLRLWDFTLQDNIRDYGGSGRRPQDALKNLFRTFADDAPYPRGQMRFEITPAILAFSGVYRETVTYPTDGGTLWAATLRALSLGATVVGAGAALLGQVEVAVPLFVIAGLAAGAAGAFNVADRLAHGDFEWDTQTALDLLDIAGAVLTAGVATGVTATARGVGQVTLAGRIQISIGQAQLALMAGIHVGAINAAIQTGDRDQVARAILAAIRDGALVLIVHRASARLGRPGVDRPPEPATGGGLRTSAGAGSRTGFDPTATTEPPRTTARPGTPEYYRQVHEGWAETLAREGLGPRPNVPAPEGAPPLGRGTVAERLTTPQEAYRVYEEALARAPGREVGIYRNLDTGEYAVRVGGEMEVSGPPRGRWETVLHYHPNPNNVLTLRMPAPADIQGTAVDAVRAGRTITEFVEYPIPGVGRGRVAYTVQPRPLEITIEYSRPDGSRVRRSFTSLEDYQAAYGSRTTYLDPNSPEYRWVMQDLQDYYAGRSGDLGGRTARGTTRSGPRPGEPEWQRVQREALAESLAYWREPGQTTETRFARHEQNFNSIAATLRNTAADLARRGRATTLPAPNEAVLQRPVDDFIRNTGRLNTAWQQLLADARLQYSRDNNPHLAQEMIAFLEGRRTADALSPSVIRDFLAGRYQPAAGRVGTRTPDIVEFFLERGEIIVTDITLEISRVHRFKTDFYRAVIEALVGRTGPRVYAIDINPARPQAAAVSP